MSTIAAELRHRRAASFRCPVMVDGRRDPMSRPTTRAPIEVRAIGARTVEFVGSDNAVYRAIKAVGAKSQRAPRGGAWLVRQDTADDVMAWLEHHSYTLEVSL